MTWSETFFNFSPGLNKTIEVPLGTCTGLKSYFEDVTEKLGLEVVRYKDNAPYWNTRTPAAHVSNGVASKTVFWHNQLIRALYRDFSVWSKSPPRRFWNLQPEKYENLTPEFAHSIWYGFSSLELEYDRWTADVYTREMEMIFQVLQGNETDGLSFGEKPLTDKQAADVINLFSQYFDKDDVGLTLPNDSDWLAGSDDYAWCRSHGAWLWDAVEAANRDEDGERIDPDNIICPAVGCDEVIG